MGKVQRVLVSGVNIFNLLKVMGMEGFCGFRARTCFNHQLLSFLPWFWFACWLHFHSPSFLFVGFFDLVTWFPKPKRICVSFKYQSQFLRLKIYVEGRVKLYSTRTSWYHFIVRRNNPNIARIANAVPCHSFFKGHNVIVNTFVHNCQKCNQCLKCQVSGHKSSQSLFANSLSSLSSFL